MLRSPRKAESVMKAGLSTAVARLWRVVAGTELRRNVLETYGTRVLVVAVTFATAVVIARVLGPTGRGFYAVAATVGALGVQFGNLGLHASNTYYVAKDRALLPALIGNTLAVVFMACVVAVLSGIALSIWPQLSPIHGTLLALALASIPVGLAYLLTQGLLLGVNEVRAYNNLECGGKLLALVLVCILAVAHSGSVERFFGVTLLSVLATFLWALLRLRRASTDPPGPSLAVFRESIGIGTRAYIIAFFGFLLLRIDLLMVKYLLGPTEAKTAVGNQSCTCDSRADVAGGRDRHVGCGAHHLDRLWSKLPPGCLPFRLAHAGNLFPGNRNGDGSIAEQRRLSANYRSGLDCRYHYQHRGEFLGYPTLWDSWRVGRLVCLLFLDFSCRFCRGVET